MIGLLRLGFDEGITVDGIADALREHAGDVPGEDVEQLAAVLELFLRTVPDALATALGMSKDPHCGRAVAFATGSILNYLRRGGPVARGLLRDDRNCSTTPTSSTGSWPR